MKNIIIIFMLLSSMANAQTDSTAKSCCADVCGEDCYTPCSGFAGLALNVAGLINNITINPPKDNSGNNLLLLRYYKSPSLALRLGFGLGIHSNKWSSVDSVGTAQVRMDSTHKQVNFFIAPAVEYHLLSSKRLDPYVGAALEIGVIGKTKATGITSVIDTIGTNKTERTGEQDGGVSLGLNLFSGFNYFFAKNFSLGLEYGAGFYRTRSGGDWSLVTINTPVSGAQNVKREIGSDYRTETGFKVNPMVALNVSYFFALSRR